MKTILLVGLGNIGVRYLEGLACIKTVAQIDILEIDSNAVVSNKNLINSVKRSKCIAIEELRINYDVCIVATTSKHRASIIAEIAAKSDITNWVIEKVLAQTIAEIEKIGACVSNKNAWVNTPRRVSTLYQHIKSKLPNSKIHFKIAEGNFSIACNSIHFIDTVAWLKNTTLHSIKIHSETNWIKSKRNNYFELKGSLEAIYGDGSQLNISNLNCKEINYKTIETINETFFIDEKIGYRQQSKEFKTRLEYLSETTPRIVDELLTTNNCGLPTLKASSEMHNIMLQAFYNCENLRLESGGIVPIT